MQCKNIWKKVRVSPKSFRKRWYWYPYKTSVDRFRTGSFLWIYLCLFCRNRVQERLGDRISGLISDRGQSDRLSLNERSVPERLERSSVTERLERSSATERLERSAMNSSGSGSGSEGNPTKFLIPGRKAKSGTEFFPTSGTKCHWINVAFFWFPIQWKILTDLINTDPQYWAKVLLCATKILD